MTRAAEMLTRIPDLATEAEVWPVPRRAEGRGGRQLGSPMPATLAGSLDLAEILVSLAEGVRVVVEERRREDLWEPSPAETPTWASECDYLLTTLDWWDADPWCREWLLGSPDTKGAIVSAYGKLKRLAGEAREARLECPGCRGRMHRIKYGATDEARQVLACGDCGKLIGPPDVAREVQARTPMALPDIAPIIGVTDRTLRRWADAGLLHPVSAHKASPKRPALYLPGDAQRVAGMTRAR